MIIEPEGLQLSVLSSHFYCIFLPDLCQILFSDAKSSIIWFEFPIPGITENETLQVEKLGAFLFLPALYKMLFINQ